MMQAMTIPIGEATEAHEIGGLPGRLVDLMEELGGPGAAIAIAAENLFPPIPSELILPLAGFTASQAGSNMSLLDAILWTTFGSVVGALLLYYLGVWIGRERIRSLIVRMPLVKVSDFDRTEAWFLKHEDKTIFFGRMIPVFRSLISIPAGVERMPLRHFVAFTAAGSAIWNTALIYAGYQLGARWSLVEGYVGILQKVVIAVVVVAAIVVTTKLVRRRRLDPATNER